jgi:predicted kinase
MTTSNYITTRSRHHNSIIRPHRMATVHLISGLPCSGKTTYSSTLREKVGGVLITLDQWLITTYGRYRIVEVGQDEHVRRVVACRELIWSVAAEFLRRDVDVILDDGFFLRSDRSRYFRMAGEVDAQSWIHAVSVPMSTLRARIEARNAQLPKYNFWIDPELLESFVAQYETPQADEADRIVAVAVS